MERKSTKKSFLSVVFAIFMLLLFIISLQTSKAEESLTKQTPATTKENTLRYDGLYRVKSAASPGYWNYLRFYKDGTVLVISFKSDNLEEVVSWLSKSTASAKKRGMYRTYIGIGRTLISGSHIEFSEKSPDGIVDYEGEIEGEMLKLNSHSRISGTRRHNVYQFVSVPSLQKSVVLVDYLTAVVQYDEYQRPESIFLKNREGNVVAKKFYEFNIYNPTQINRENTTDISGEIIRKIDYENGKPKNPMWLCLDEKGNIIEKAGKPILVKPFDAKQRSESENVYHGAFISEKITNYFPCKNCAEKTGIKNCKYVW